MGPHSRAAIRFKVRQEMEKYQIDKQVIFKLLDIFDANPDEAYLGINPADLSLIIRLPSPPMDSGSMEDIMAWNEKYVLDFFTPEKISLMGPYYKNSVITSCQGMISYFKPIEEQ